MVETLPVSGKEHFATVCSGDEESPLNDAQSEELWDLWTDYEDKVGERKLIQLPEWFSESEFGARRPYLFASVEHDDSSSGAVLFSDAVKVNISIVENEALTKTDEITPEDSVDVLDISDEDDYIDEPGKVWIPRSLMSVYEQT